MSNACNVLQSLSDQGNQALCHAEWVAIDMAFWWHSEAASIFSDCAVTAPNRTSSLSRGKLLNSLIELHTWIYDSSLVGGNKTAVLRPFLME